MQKRIMRVRMMEQVRQNMRDLYREHRGSVIRFDYEEQTAKVFLNGHDEGLTIFGNFFVALKKLANGAKSCSVEKAYERMMAAILVN